MNADRPVTLWSMLSCWSVSPAWAKIRDHKRMASPSTPTWRVEAGGFRIARMNNERSV